MSGRSLAIACVPLVFAACLSATPKSWDSGASSDDVAAAGDAVDDAALDATPGADAAPDVTANPTCRQIVDCTQAHSPCLTEVCVNDCIADADPDTTYTFRALADCMKAHCGTLADLRSAVTLVDCLLIECKDAYLRCIPAGTAGCADVQACFEGCGEDGKKGDGCDLGCLYTGTYDAQAVFVKLGACYEQNCPDMSDDECDLAPCQDLIQICE